MWAGLCWLIVRFGDQGPALGAVSRKKANLWSHSKIWHDWVKLKIMTSESRWRSWDGVLRFLNTATRLQKVDSSKETPGILPKLRLVRVSLEAWAWLYLVAYLQVAILLTLQKYHLETGMAGIFVSLYILPDYKDPLHSSRAPIFPITLIVMGSDWGHTNLSPGSRMRWTNISINDTKWSVLAEWEITQAEPRPFGCLRYPLTADIWDIITPCWLSARKIRGRENPNLALDGSHEKDKSWNILSF